MYRYFLSIHEVEAMFGFVSDVLAEKDNSVFLVAATASAREAVRIMNVHGVGALLVLEKGKLSGIFTERDVLRRIVDAGRDPNATQVRQAMTTDVITVSPSLPVADAMTLMTRHRVRHLPVVADNGDITGLVSIGDLTRRVAQHQAQELEQMAGYITGA
jgi:CBS domain-containing protein